MGAPKCTGNISRFVIYTISSGFDTVIKQLTDSTLTEYVVDGLLPERNYTIAVRGYYKLLGPAGTTTVRLEGKNIIKDFVYLLYSNHSFTVFNDYLYFHQNHYFCDSYSIAGISSINGSLLSVSNDLSILNRYK